MHVADVTMFYASQSGGIRRYLQEKRRWLEARPQYRHSLVLPSRAAAAGESVVEVPSVPLPFSQGYRLPIATRPAVRALIALHPDIIEAGDPYHLAWAVLEAGRTLGVPVTAFCHSDLPRLARKLGGLPAERLAEAYLRRLYSRFDAVLAPSACMAERLRALGIGRVHLQPLGVDTTVFRPECRDDAWRARLGVAPGDKMLVFVGRFAPEKNLPDLYAALDRLGPGFVLVLAGSGPAPSRSDVRIVPFINEATRLASLIASCDVFVHAGDQETFGLAMLEAMACGVPVVAIRAGGLAELVDDEVGAAVLPGPGRGNAIADAVRGVLARDLVPLQLAARRRALLYSWQRMIPEIVACYATLRGDTTEALAS